MRFIRVATAALNQTPLDWEGNVANIRRAIEIARERDVSLLCLPELCITGYGCEDAFFSTDVLRRAERALEEVLPLTHGLLVTIGLPILHVGGLFNATAVLVDGQLAGVVAKQYLAGDGLHYEPRWFKPWPANVVSRITLAGRNCLIGDLMFDLNGIRVGLEICEDAWVANRPGVDHANLAADIIMNPSASHFAFGKAETRRRLVEEASRSLGVTYVYSNLLGNEAGRIIYDGQTLVATNGELVACGPRLLFGAVCVTDAVVDVDSTRLRRAQLVSFQPQVAIEADRIVSVDFSPASVSPVTSRESIDSWEKSEHLKEEEFTRAIALALFDYLRRSRSRGFVVSLSGGADSSAVACLVAIMVRQAVAELGYDGFCQSVGIIPERANSENEIAALTSALLTTVYQSTRNSSASTRDSARAVANALGADHLELDVDDLCEGYTRKIETALDRSLDWERDDVALQNIQARVRGPAVWMLANVRNALLLATSNRSEAAVGYATMDGDTCGGISPIAGIDKAFLRQWLKWLEAIGPHGLSPIPELAIVNRLEPTAELRPLSFEQTDEGDLMPYDLLDSIEHHAIGEKRSPQEVFECIRAEFDFDYELLLGWVRRFFELWSRNQWKRERYAPSFHVDDKNLDPKTWCRFPILSGGFRSELSDLSDET